MADTDSEKISHVDYYGRTIVDAKALLRNPKVRETLDRLSKANEQYRGKPGVTFLRPKNSAG